MFSKEIGIDLGTANTLVFLKGKGIINREPSVVALDTKTDTVLAVGEEAKNMIGRTPGSVIAVRPLKDGVIADFDIAALMLKYFISKTVKSMFFSKPKVVICIPSGVTVVERRAVEDAAKQSGVGTIELVEEPFAAALGAGLPISDAKGNMIVDIGGGTTEVAVLSLGGIVTATSERVAGDKFDEAIISYIRKKYNILIGERTAENLKILIGSATPYEDEGEIAVRGRNLIDGFPKTVVICAKDIREALADPLKHVIEAIKKTLENTPPELASDLMDTGITLTGGGALLRGIDSLISSCTNIPVHVAESPLDCVASGAGRCLESSEKKQLRRFRKYR